jgi:rod shape-determining protein MreD
MILTSGIIVRLAALGAFVAIAQIVCFSKMDVFGSQPDVILLVVISLGLLGGSLTGAVAGFSIGLLMDCLLLETLGGFALAMLSVGYVAGRYREAIGPPTRGAVVLLGGALTLLGAVLIAAIQIGTGVDATVSVLVVRDAIIKSLIGAVLAIPVLWIVRLVVRSALVDERRAAGRRPGVGGGVVRRRPFGEDAAGTR